MISFTKLNYALSTKNYGVLIWTGAVEFSPDFWFSFNPISATRFGEARLFRDFDSIWIYFGLTVFLWGPLSSWRLKSSTHSSTWKRGRQLRIRPFFSNIKYFVFLARFGEARSYFPFIIFAARFGEARSRIVVEILFCCLCPFLIANDPCVGETLS